MLVSYNWLKDYLGEDLPAVDKVVDLLTAHSFEVESAQEKENDTIIDIKVLPDRAGDCLSHRGVARELATLLNKNLAFDPLNVTVHLPVSNQFKITITEDKLCTRFMVAHMTGVTVGPSPEWLVERSVGNWSKINQ
jgi:phenylalanyl-tRNA synthetase beta chain